MKNYYHILQVERYASAQEIKRSYRKLVLQYHPDKNFGNSLYAEKFIEIREAYEVLSDSFKRQWYDEYFFAPLRIDTVSQPQPVFVRRDVSMNKRDKQIFYGGIALFIVLVSALLYFFFDSIPPKTPVYTDWAIRDKYGNEHRLTQTEFDSMLQQYHLKPDQVKYLIDSLRNQK
jgi:curved DNA-binding protein CbpA